MHRRIGLSFVLVVGFLVTLGMAPAMLARQGGEGDWSGMDVTCGDEQSPCQETEQGRYQDYRVALPPESFFPEVTFNEAMVVRVFTGTLAFRVTSQDVDVVVEHSGNGIPIYTTDIPLDVGQDPDPANPPVFSPTGETMQQLALCPQSPLSKLCLLEAKYFLDGIQTDSLQTDGLQTYVLLSDGDIVYLTAGSMCFLCNIEDTGAAPAQIEIWAPGYSGSTWWGAVTQMWGPAPTRLEGDALHDVRGWMLNPGSPCH